jgi:hypothetical protein
VDGSVSCWLDPRTANAQNNRQRPIFRKSGNSDSNIGMITHAWNQKESGEATARGENWKEPTNRRPAYIG